MPAFGLEWSFIKTSAARHDRMFAVQRILAADGGFDIMDAATPSPASRFILQEGAGFGLL